MGSINCLFAIYHNYGILTFTTAIPNLCHNRQRSRKNKCVFRFVDSLVSKLLWWHRNEPVYVQYPSSRRDGDLQGGQGTHGRVGVLDTGRTQLVYQPHGSVRPVPVLLHSYRRRIHGRKCVTFPFICARQVTCN